MSMLSLQLNVAKLTILSCASASGYALPPMMVYPRKKAVLDHLKEGAVPNTLFKCSETEWINKDLYLEWFQFFLQNIPPTRPVLLLQDGHSSHISIELIELACQNDVHLLCFPAHTTHILQPLDVGVFKSFKANSSKACHKYIINHPGRVITSDVIATLVAEAWPMSLTPVNIMGGFKKCGIYPINPGEVRDRQLAPSKALQPQKPSQVGSESEKIKQLESSSDSPVAGNELFTPEEEVLYKRRYDEGYDLADPGYMAWLKINHPELSSAYGNCSTSDTSTSNSAEVATCRAKSPDVLSQLLVLPEPRKATRRRRKPALNSKTVCITDIEALDELKVQELEKTEAEAMKKAKQLEREQKRQRKEEKRKAKEKQNLKSSQTKSVLKKSKPKTASRTRASRKGEKCVSHG